MSKAETLQLVQDLSGGLADPVTSEAFYRDVVVTLGQSELLVAASLIQHGTGVNVFDAPPSTLKILGVFYDDTALSMMTQRAMEAIDMHWRDRVGFPQAVVTDTEGDQRFRIYPEPEAPSSTFAFPHGAPFGRDFPQQAVGVIHSEARQDLPVWLELPVALLVIAREFQRESDHRDQAFAEAAFTIGQAVMAMVT